MVLIMCFGFMMLVASLIESPIARTRMWQKRNTHLANFDVTSLRVTATAPRQQADIQVVCDEATRKAMIAAREQFLKHAKKNRSRSSQNWKVGKPIGVPRLPHEQVTAEKQQPMVPPVHKTS
jgi:hypothetical protein